MVINDELDRLIKSAPNPYVPKKLPIDMFALVKPDVLRLLTSAHKALGEYNGFLVNTPNPMLLLSPMTTQEAVLSSKLEGTHATLEDILNHEAGVNTSIEKDELQEIINYRNALTHAIQNISTVSKLPLEGSRLPLTVNIIRQMHRILLNNVRGSSKHPGQFKVTQNYIGGKSFISFTPLPVMLTEEYMSNLERYINSEEIDILIQAAIIHAQFEMIHPFEDGNGRIGRLLIPLYFYYKELIPMPVFYMSSYFNADRELYIQKLSCISKTDSWSEWIVYFLHGVIDQAKENTKKAKAILDLYNRYKDSSVVIKSYHYIDVLDFAFQHPIFNISMLSEKVQASKQTLYNILNKMIDLKILSTNEQARNRSYILNDLIKIVNY